MTSYVTSRKWGKCRRCSSRSNSC